jgi:putative transcriptional regulator
VLNKPTTVTVKEAVSQLDEPPDGAPESPLLLGGPCQGPLVALHTDEDAGEIRVLDGLWFSAEKLRVEQVMDRSGGERALYFAGYSGWGAKQLEGELDEGAWLVVPAEPKWIFDPPANLWGKLITATTAGEGLGVEQIPDDPSLN